MMWMLEVLRSLDGGPWETIAKGRWAHGSIPNFDREVPAEVSRIFDELNDPSRALSIPHSWAMDTPIGRYQVQLGNAFPVLRWLLAVVLLLTLAHPQRLSNFYCYQVRQQPKTTATFTVARAWSASEPDRDATEQPERVLDALNIPQAATVADVGAGAGYFTWRLAERVGPMGKVIAEDIDQKMLDALSEEMKQRHITNVQTVLGRTGDPHLPENSVDVAMLVHVYHEFSEPGTMISHIRQALKSDGRLVVVEYRKENSVIPLGLNGRILPEHKMTVKEVRSGIEPLGFRLQQVLEFLPTQHIIVFRRKGLKKS